MVISIKKKLHLWRYITVSDEEEGSESQELKCKRHRHTWQPKKTDYMP